MSRMPRYRYVVVYKEIPYAPSHIVPPAPYWSSVLFKDSTAAAQFADGKTSATVYGLNPEYGVVSAALSLEY